MFPTKQDYVKGPLRLSISIIDESETGSIEVHAWYPVPRDRYRELFRRLEAVVEESEWMTRFGGPHG